MPGVKGHLYCCDWGSQAGHRGAATFIEATTTGLTEVTLEHLIALQSFAAVLDDLFALTINTVHFAGMFDVCIS